MPEAAGAVAAGAVADRLLGPKERLKLAIILVSNCIFVVLCMYIVKTSGCQGQVYSSDPELDCAFLPDEFESIHNRR